MKFAFAGEGERPSITRCKQLIFAVIAAVPDRPYRVNDEARGQPIAFGDFGAAGRTTVERTAFFAQFRPCRAMNRAIDAPATEQRIVGGVYDGIYGELRYVADDDLEAGVVAFN